MVVDDGVEEIECVKARGQRRVLYRLQLETRSLYHPFFMRPLVNRMGQVGIYCFQ